MRDSYISKHAKRKIVYIMESSLVFVFVIMFFFVKVSLSVSETHPIRFMSPGFVSCVLLATAMFGFIMFKVFKELDKEHHIEGLKNKKHIHANGSCECNGCGSRTVVKTDKSCGICGTTFDES